MNGIERFLCLASRATGHDFLRECAEMGVRTTLLTLDGLRDDASWPRNALEDLATMPPGLNREQILNTVSWMARGRRYDRIIALHGSDLETAAQIREHMRIPGMGATTASCYRDKLAMRVIPRAFGYTVPEFCRVLNYDELRDFMNRVAPPWMLRPRVGDAEAQTIKEPEQLWRALGDLGDAQSRYLLEEVFPGETFFLDSIVSECEVRLEFVRRTQYEEGQVPGAESDHRRDLSSREEQRLAAMNRGLAPSLGMVRGVTHARYVRADADGQWYFLEIAAGVDPDSARAVEASTGVNLWREWARMEIDDLRGETYVTPRLQRFAAV